MACFSALCKLKSETPLPMTSEQEKLVNLAREKIWLARLSGTKRFAGKEGSGGFEMTHRTDNFIHVRRVMYLGRCLVSILLENPSGAYKPDLRKVSDMGYHHDDSEIIIGDVLATEKKTMSAEKLEGLHQQEDLAASAVAHFIFGLQPPNDRLYVDRQKEIREKETLESQIVDVADKWDALCEITHEIRCGNKSFSRLLAFSEEKFESFSKYPFLATIKAHPLLQFGNIPTEEQVLQLPAISIDDLKRPEDVTIFMSFEKTAGWPTYYRTWANISRLIFDKSPEKFLFPGWYLQLWRDWKKPTSQTTASGLWVPRG